MRFAHFIIIMDDDYEDKGWDGGEAIDDEVSGYLNIVLPST